MSVIFHGGCLSCKSQQLKGIDRCVGCQYFDANWNLPDLSITDASEADLKRIELKVKHKIPLTRKEKRINRK
jgi:hypothetical protein